MASVVDLLLVVLEVPLREAKRSAADAAALVDEVVAMVQSSYWPI